MAGRKPKPTAVKKLEGNPGKRKLNTKEPVPAKGMPDCPEWLLPEAKKEWEKKLHAIDREMTTPLFLLRCVQLGISIRDLDLLTIGMVNDMFVESRNDEYKGWRQVATQEDFDRF